MKRAGAIDDSYLYRFDESEWILVVNAANREKDWDHFQKHIGSFTDISLTDKTDKIAMISLQGPKSRDILERLMTAGRIPEAAAQLPFNRGAGGYSCKDSPDGVHRGAYLF